MNWWLTNFSLRFMLKRNFPIPEMHHHALSDVLPCATMSSRMGRVGAPSTLTLQPADVLARHSIGLGAVEWRPERIGGMGSTERLLRKLFAQNARLTHSEAKTLLEGLGYEMRQSRGSGAKFIKADSFGVRYHVPHGGKKELPEYVLKCIREEVRKEIGDVR